MEKEYTIKEAAEKFGVSFSIMYHGVERDLIPYKVRKRKDGKYVNGRCTLYYIKHSDAKRYVEEAVPIFLSGVHERTKSNAPTAPAQMVAAMEARRRMEDRREAKRLGMTIDEYDEIVLGGEKS